jgi:ribosomal protein S1
MIINGVSVMTYDEYKAAIKAIDSNRERAKAIAKRLRPLYWTYSIDSFDEDSVLVTCYYKNYDDDKLMFPAEWLFRADWEHLVDIQLAQETEKAEAKIAAQKAETEAKERAEFERLKAKYDEEKTE